MPLLAALQDSFCNSVGSRWAGRWNARSRGDRRKHRPAQALQRWMLSQSIGAHPRSKRARTREGGSGTRIDRCAAAHIGAAMSYAGPLQRSSVNHFCRPTTAAANAINERDAAPDAAIRRPSAWRARI